jgi:hypothetical protein
VVDAVTSERGNVADVVTELSYHHHRRIARELQRFVLDSVSSLPPQLPLR